MTEFQTKRGRTPKVAFLLKRNGIQLKHGLATFPLLRQPSRSMPLGQLASPDCVYFPSARHVGPIGALPLPVTRRTGSTRNPTWTPRECIPPHHHNIHSNRCIRMASPSMPSPAPAIPLEAITSARCYRDACPKHERVMLARTLVPEHVSCNMASDVYDEVICAHPLARHVPLFVAHVRRLRDTTEALCQAYPSTWTKAWSVNEVLECDAMQQLWSHIQSIQHLDTHQLRASLRIHADGSTRAVIAPLHPPSSSILTVRLDTQSVLLPNGLVSYKTDARATYDAARARVKGTLGIGSPSSSPPSHGGDATIPPSCFDVLLWHYANASENSEAHAEQIVTESSIANLVLELPNEPVRFVTPSFSHLLPGILVQELVRQGLVQPRTITVTDIYAQKTRLWLCNAVRGMFPVELVP